MRALRRMRESSVAVSLAVGLALATSACSGSQETAAVLRAAPHLCEHLATLRAEQNRVTPAADHELVVELDRSRQALLNDASAIDAPHDPDMNLVGGQVDLTWSYVAEEIGALQTHNDGDLRLVEPEVRLQLVTLAPPPGTRPVASPPAPSLTAWVAPCTPLGRS